MSKINEEEDIYDAVRSYRKNHPAINSEDITIARYKIKKHIAEYKEAGRKHTSFMFLKEYLPHIVDLLSDYSFTCSKHTEVDVYIVVDIHKGS